MNAEMKVRAIGRGDSCAVVSGHAGDVTVIKVFDKYDLRNAEIFADGYNAALTAAEAENAALKGGLEKALLTAAANQAKIDALMFEWCPNEMTPEQIEEWGKHQRVATDAEQTAIDGIAK